MNEPIMTLLAQRMRKECHYIKLSETQWRIDNDPTPLTQGKVPGAPFFPAALAGEYPRNTFIQWLFKE